MQLAWSCVWATNNSIGISAINMIETEWVNWIGWGQGSDKPVLKIEKKEEIRSGKPVSNVAKTAECRAVLTANRHHITDMIIL